jgi:hypothetical protein
VTVHSITWLIEDGSLHGKAHCAGGDDAPCRSFCAQGCEEPCDHEARPYGRCAVAEWMDIEPALEFYRGPRVPVRDGAIDVAWDTQGQHWTWQYAVGDAIQPGDIVLFQPAEEPVSQYWKPRVGREFIALAVSDGQLLMWEDTGHDAWGSLSGGAISCRVDSVTVVARTQRLVGESDSDPAPLGNQST